MRSEQVGLWRPLAAGIGRIGKRAAVLSSSRHELVRGREGLVSGSVVSTLYGRRLEEWKFKREGAQDASVETFW